MMQSSKNVIRHPGDDPRAILGCTAFSMQKKMAVRDALLVKYVFLVTKNVFRSR